MHAFISHFDASISTCMRSSPTSMHRSRHACIHLPLQCIDLDMHAFISHFNASISTCMHSSPTSMHRSRHVCIHLLRHSGSPAILAKSSSNPDRMGSPLIWEGLMSFWGG